MKRRNLPLNALRAFEVAARHSSVSGAARELAVTHSAVSHQLKQLESQLGTRLFERTNRGLVITASGELLLPVLSECLDRIEATLDQVGNGQADAVLQVTSTPTFASKWLVPRLGDWYRQPSASRIHLLPSLDELDTGGDIDFAIRCGIPPWPDCAHHLLMPIHLVPVCSPGYLASGDPIESPIDCLRHPLIHADIGDQPPGQEWRDWLQGCGVDCPTRLDGMSVKDPALAMQAAADGLGLAMGYRELIDADLQSARLVCASDRLTRHAYSYYLVHHQAQPLTAVQAAFSDWLIAQL